MKTYDLPSTPTADTIKLVSAYLEDLTTHNTSKDEQGLTSFHARSIPTIDILSYMNRIQKYCPTSNECYLAIVVYLHRIIRLNNQKQFELNFTVDSYSIHRLIIACIMTSSKYYSDVFYTNTRYAKVGGIPVIELNHLELELLISLDFDLCISIPELQYYGDQLSNSTLSFEPPRQPFPWLDSTPVGSEVSSPASVSTVSSELPSTIRTPNRDCMTLNNNKIAEIRSQTIPFASCHSNHNLNNSLTNSNLNSSGIKGI